MQGGSRVCREWQAFQVMRVSFMTRCSALFPGQAVKAPASDTAALVMLVEFALEALVDVKDTLEAGICERASGFFRTLAAATDEDDRGAAVLCVTTLTTKHQLSDLCNKMRIDVPVRFVDPGNMHGADRMADKKKFHRRADIHEDGTRIIPEHLRCLLGRKIMHLCCHPDSSDLPGAGMNGR